MARQAAQGGVRGSPSTIACPPIRALLRFIDRHGGAEDAAQGRARPLW